MAKSAFSEQEQKIWGVLAPAPDPGGLSNVTRQNLAHRIGEVLNLFPVITRVGESFRPFDPRDLINGAGSKPNGGFNLYYLSHDCEDATGSQAKNWLQWAAARLGYKREDHPLAPRLYPPADLMEEMESRQLIGRTKVTRFLSVETVAFYLAAQTQTWGDPIKIAKVKNRINAILNRPGLCIPIPPEDDVDTSDLFSQHPRAPQGKSVTIEEGMTIAEMEANLKAAQTMLLARQEADREARARDFKVVASTPHHMEPVPESITIRMGTGEEHTFTNVTL